MEVCLQARPDAILISGQILDRVEDRESVIQQLHDPIRKVILLDDGTDRETFEAVIEKYQSARKVYEELCYFLGEKKEEWTEIIAVYCPADGTKGEYYCINQAESQSGCLILSLVEYSVFSRNSRTGDGLGELFYYLDQKGSQAMLGDAVYTEGNTDYMRGFHTIYDMNEIRLEQWKVFYEDILRQSRYKTVYLVFDRLPPYLELFLWCDQIRVQWGEDAVAEVRRKGFVRIAGYMGMEGIVEKISEL